MPETLETIAAKIDALNKRFSTDDQQFTEMRAQLGAKIDALDAKVMKVYDEVIAMRNETERNASKHQT
jgi:RNA processing factor Prp31